MIRHMEPNELKAKEVYDKLREGLQRDLAGLESEEKLTLQRVPAKKFCGNCGVVTPYRDVCPYCSGFTSGMSNKWSNH